MTDLAAKAFDLSQTLSSLLKKYFQDGLRASAH
jgi:hypothetical protein